MTGETEYLPLDLKGMLEPIAMALWYPLLGYCLPLLPIYVFTGSLCPEAEEKRIQILTENSET